MALVTVQRSPSPNASAEGDEGDIVDASESSIKSPRQRRRSRSALKKLKKLFNTVRFVTKLKPCFSENYFTVKGAALILPQSDFETAYSRKPTKQHGGDEIQSHLQAMFSLLRPQDTIKVAVKLEGSHTRYLAVVSCIGRQDTEESIILGIDILEKADVGLIIPLWAHTRLKLDGDGGFSITADNNVHCFKPVSVQAMWSALQSLNKVVKIATDKLYLPRGLTHTWMGFYEAKLTTNSTFISEWNASQDIDNSYRDTSSANRDMERLCSRSRSVDSTQSEELSREEALYRTIKTELKKVMMSVDLEEVTCLYLRKAVEEQMGMDLREHRNFIDTEMLAILGQMDAPSKILDYLYLGSEWNASNLEELQTNGVQHILNISREIDNFFPGILHYYNVREWDVEGSNLQKYWDDTYKFINKARKRGSKTLVHCKMGISRSASTVIAFLMKEMRWSLQEAYEFCKAKRSIINPNVGFWTQLEEYEGILKANWNRDKFNLSNQPEHLSTTEEKDDLPPDLQIGPEEAQLMKLGLGASGEEGYMYTEKDIDLASRSADSTEDSVPDNFSPDATKQKKSHHRKKSDKNAATESSDFPGVSSDSSDYTDSEELSTTDDDDDDSDDDDEGQDRIFKPIDAADNRNFTSDEDSSKKAVKVETKRSKSESDKATVKVDEGMTLRVEDNTGQAFSREGSQSRIKPDGSWIKPASDSDVEGEGETAQTETDEKEEKECPSDDDKATETSDPKESVEEGVEIKVFVSEDMEVTSEDTEQITGDSDLDQKGEDKDLDPYTRENIPWNPGMVKKQRDDIEGKFAGDKKETSNDAEMMDTSRKSFDDTKHELKCPLAKPEIKLDLVGDTEEPMVCEVSEKSEEVPMDTSESKSDGEKARDSVYAREEIDLPEGIVRKTTQEIEERNKLSAETPKKKIQRSSSMKTLRVTPKAKDRDNERRKTCIAILSPSHRSEPDLQIYKFDDDSRLSDMDQSSMPLADQGDSDAISFQASGDTEENGKMAASTLKVYKFMGEELTVEEGLVRKQKMDIEQNTWKQQTKPEEEPVSHDHKVSPISSVGTEQPVHSKQVDPPCLISDSNADVCFDSVAQLEEKLSTKQDDSDSGSIDCAHIQKVDVIKASLGDKGSCKPTDKEPSSSAQGRKLSNQESRFDRETLELIREIGSALLNSPAKPTVEQEEETLPQGKGLVGRFVKQIEHASGLHKKKAKREIIVIDKDTSPVTNSRPEAIEQKPGAQSSAHVYEGMYKQSEPSHSDSVTKPSSFIKHAGNDGSHKHIQSSEQQASPLSSPVSKSTVSKDPKTSSPSQSEAGAMDLSDMALQLGSAALGEQKSDQSQEDSTSEVCSVKNFVKKFEQHDSCSGKSPPMFVSSPISSLNAQLFPGAKCDMDMMEVDRPYQAGAMSDSSDTSPHSPSKMACRLKHRRSEPVITMSDRSVHTLTPPRSSDFSASLSDQGVLSEENESADSIVSESAMSDITSVRPRSAGQSQRFGRGRRSDSRRTTLTYSHTMPHSETEEFSQDNRKVRKPYGRTHPLARLEDGTYIQNRRSNPFYNTM